MRRRIAWWVVLGVGAAVSGPGEAVAVRRPNVILLMPDQMRGQAMGVAGNGQVETPHLDELARQGVFLPNTIANNPVCCPARATILTGEYPHRHGLVVNDLRLRESQTTMAELLAAAGYATGFVGKWHLDGGRRMPGFVPPGPRRQGFAFWAANECNHQHFDSVYFRDSDQPIPIKRFEPEVWTDEAIRFIRQNRDRPFFLWWTCGPPHNPYRAPPRFEAMYDAEKLVMRPNWRSGVAFGSREDIARYYAAITAIDEQVGRLMQVLDELGLTDDTIVVFTSDHGDMLGSQGCAFKCKPWTESIRVPGIVRYPRKIRAGSVRDTLMSHVDLAPTLLSFCGVTVPAEMQGHDLSGLLSEGGTAGGAADSARHAAAEPEAVFLQIYEPRPRWSVPAAWRGVRTHRHVYARFEEGPWVLYDLKRDPYQLKNLAKDPAYGDLRDKLDALIAAEMTRTGDAWTVNCTSYEKYYKGPAVYHPDRRRGEAVK